MKGVMFALALPAVVGAIWATIAAFQMGMWLSRHGVAVNWFWFRVLIPRYVGQYKTMTEARDGKPGPLYLHFVIPRRSPSRHRSWHTGRNSSKNLARCQPASEAGMEGKSK